MMLLAVSEQGKADMQVQQAVEKSDGLAVGLEQLDDEEREAALVDTRFPQSKN